MSYDWCSICGGLANDIFAFGTPLPKCRRCRTEQQIIDIQSASKQLPALKALLAALGGPTSKIYCGYIRYTTEHPEWLGEFCKLPLGHDGDHIPRNPGDSSP